LGKGAFVPEGPHMQLAAVIVHPPSWHTGPWRATVPFRWAEQVTTGIESATRARPVSPVGGPPTADGWASKWSARATSASAKRLILALKVW